MFLNPLRRVREARRKAEETDLLFDRLARDSVNVYQDAYRAIMRAREELAETRLRHSGRNHGEGEEDGG